MSSALASPSPDLPGAGRASASSPNVAPAVHTTTNATQGGTGAGVVNQNPELEPVVSLTTHGPISALTVPAMPAPTLATTTQHISVDSPTQALSMTPQHLSRLPAGLPKDAPVNGSNGDTSTPNRVLTIDAITPGSQPTPSSVAVNGAATRPAQTIPSANTTTSSGILVNAQVSTVELIISVITTPAIATPSSPMSLSPNSTQQSASSPNVTMERLEMNQLSGQPSNIFDPGNRLFPLGITAVSIAGILLAILSTFLLIRLTGCTKRRRFDRNQPIPSFIDVRDTSSSFHDRSMYRDDLPYNRPAIPPLPNGRQGGGVGYDPEAGFLPYTAEKGWNGTQGNQSIIPGVGRSGWDRRDPRMIDLKGIASTSAAGLIITPKPRTQPAVYEQAFFPTAPRDLTSRRAHRYSNSSETSSTKGSPVPSSLGTIRSPFDDIHQQLNPAIKTGRSDKGSVNPFTSAHAALTLTNPDLSQQTTPSSQSQSSPSLPLRSTPGPSNLVKGFMPRSQRDSISTISSFASDTSSRSAYSHMTRAMPFILPPPMPAFMAGGHGGGGGNGGGAKGLGERRDRTESLDVPKDAVSRPGSETIMFK